MSEPINVCVQCKVVMEPPLHGSVCELCSKAYQRVKRSGSNTEEEFWKQRAIVGLEEKEPL